MPGEIIDRPNPGPSPSLIPDVVLSLAVELEKTKLDGTSIKAIQRYRAAACYIAAGVFTGKPIESIVRLNLTF